MSKILNNENFQNEVLDKGIALVDFYADWCGPCKMIAPIIEEIAKERSDVSVGKVNVDESVGIAMEYNVVHASDSIESANREIAIYFEPVEIYDNWQSTLEKLVYDEERYEG